MVTTYVRIGKFSGRATVALLALVLSAAVSATPANAEPYMALRDGYSCGDCHTNRSGGGMRSVTAEMHASDILRLPNDGQGILPAHDEWFSPNINEYFSIGADFRLTETLTFQDDPDPVTGEVENNTAFRELDNSDFDVERGTVYAHLRLIPGYLSAYIDEQVAPGGASNREAWAMLEGVLPWETYVKAGRFFPGFGIKIEDDEAFVSSASGFNFDRTLSGIEIGRAGMGWNWMAAAADGGDNFEQLIMGSTYYVWGETGPFSGLMLGGSAAHHKPGDFETNTFAAFGGASVGPFTWLAQGLYIDGEELVDVPIDPSRGAITTMEVNRGKETWAAYTELNTLLFDWLNFKIAFDWMDPNNNVSEDERNRFSVGFEPFLDRFIQLRAFYRVLNGPEDEPNTNRDELILEAHLFF